VGWNGMQHTIGRAANTNTTRGDGTVVRAIGRQLRLASNESPGLGKCGSRSHGCEHSDAGGELERDHDDYGLIASNLND
jgi:hypothetical protein